MLKVAVIGAGRMGSVVGRQLPDDVEKLIIDTDEAKAKVLADEIHGGFATTLDAAKVSDIIAVVLPTAGIDPVMDQLVWIAKDDAIIMNMATKGTVNPQIIEKNNRVHIVDTKIIGHAKSMEQGAPAYVVVKTEDQVLLKKIQHILPGFKKVLMGNADIIPDIAKIGSSEGIRAAIAVRKLLKQYNIPKDWEDIVIYTVCAGTMRSYVENDLGHFAKQLAERLDAEE
ncbi:NAD(P)-binding domain-containing protein [Desulfosporosinus sp. OT]|uniref:NAD(P)-binding domain-containing protein n=1 Tax=Desulfosporosinus sp. OT TaxID=913865 RepID=UPI0002239ED9|nr:NAD(P)-binding domain-containing protein [Desulfosporosinus sp. OT]EGW37257.1 NAD-dependent glycerol-3-phosphate dehydrogenase family protein [Desulfosporosinus sp. OT]